MSRIRGIEVKVQKEILLTRKYGLNEILKKKNEDQSSNSKDDVEKHQIKELLHKLPRLDKIFEVHRKIGEGTFSSVYLGSLRQHASLPDSEKRWFAIKHLVPTAHPARIEHELRCLQDMGGKDHVIGVELCLRNLDTIVFIMPYIPHRKFSEYVGEMDASELRQYMRALLIALRHVHSFGVIHRDVKPSNFLYDRDNRRYLLVDFGLAQRLLPAPEETPSGLVPPPAHSNGVRKRTREEEEASATSKRVALDLSTGRPVPAAVSPMDSMPTAELPAGRSTAARRDSAAARLLASPIAARLANPVGERPASPVGERLARPVGGRLASPVVERLASPVVERLASPVGGRLASPVVERLASPVGGRVASPVGGRAARPGDGPAAGAACACAGAAGVCSACLGRPACRAPRAGTQGFRPPEVLLKYPHQTTAVDVWAAGVVLASALTARYPFFRAADDVAALAELADLLGTEPLQRAAEALGRRVVTSGARRGLCLRKLAARLRGGRAPLHAGTYAHCARCRLPREHCLCRDEHKKAEEWEASRVVAGFPDAAFALAARLLDPDPRTRISAHDALAHPFLAHD